MRNIFIILFTIGAIFTVWMINKLLAPSLDIKSEYLNGKITTCLEAKNIHNITSVEFQYKTYFLEQYMNVDPRVETYSFPYYEESHIYEIRPDLFQGKKNYIDVEVVINFNNGTEEIIDKLDIENIKEKMYNDFVIEPEIINDEVHYVVDGLMAIIDEGSYDEDIIFYSNPNDENSNISVGFQKDYALYSLKSFGIISKVQAIEKNYEGFSIVESTKEQGVDESYIVIEYGIYELIWDGLYPYDLNGNKIFYESNNGNINLFVNEKVAEISKSSHEKYTEMKDKLSNIRFKILK